MSKRNPGLIKRYGDDGTFTWHIDKQIKGHGRLCEGTQTDNEDEAAEIMASRVAQIRKAIVFGLRPNRQFRVAATKYLEDFAHKPGISRQQRR